jgi:DnaJ family protein C protein 16
VFQENAAAPDVDPVPVASAAVEDLDLKTILDVVDDHQFLKLPRLSSQDIFDTLCPPGGTRLRKKLCVTLVTRLEPEHEK